MQFMHAYRRQLLMPALLRVLHFTHIELSNTVDGPTIVNYSRGLSLSFGQDNVHKVLACGDHLDCFEVVQRHAPGKPEREGPLFTKQPPLPATLLDSCWSLSYVHAIIYSSSTL